MAYLPASDHLVMFGGENFQGATLTPLNDTWVLDPIAGTWTGPISGTAPPARFDHAMSADNTGSHVVLLGGSDGSTNTLTSTWLWDGAAWTERLQPPSARRDAGMTYDRARNKHVLFGGRPVATGLDVNETWELEGLNWRAKTPGISPSARSEVAMAFDRGRNTTVMFGGRLANGVETDETWEWNGTSWTLRTFASGSPPAAAGCQLVYDTIRGKSFVLVGSTMWSYDGSVWAADQIPPPGETTSCGWDPTRGRMVVFGGRIDPATSRTGFWEWNGQSWSKVSFGGGPSWRFRHAMAYDTVHSELVMFGGVDFSSFFFPDTYAWDGAAWTLRSQSGPAGRQLAGMVSAFSPRRQVMFGGGSTLTGAYLNDTWEWNGTQWTAGASSAAVPQREGPAMAFDPVRNVVVMYGGLGGVPGNSPKIGDTWEYDGTQWTQRLPDGAPGSPGPRFGAAMAWDPATAQVLLFGGFDNAGVRSDTWTWNGTAWTQRFAARSPAPRADSGIVNDGIRLLLFSGWDTGSGANFNDIWSWNGTNWQQIDSGTPKARVHHGAAFDERRGRTVVFGGQSANGLTYYNETWEWDGDSWLQRFPTNAPTPRSRSRLTFDENRGLVVLYGGWNGINELSDTWEWDGEQWLQRGPIAVPPSSQGHGLTFDADRDLTVAFGSFGTWDYGTTLPGLVEPVRPAAPGCIGSFGVPNLSPLPWAGAWLGSSFEASLQNIPPGFGVFVWGFSGFVAGIPLFSLGSPACNLDVAPDVLEVLFPVPATYVSAPMPSSTVFLGAFLFCQGAFFDLGQPGAPVITSNSLRLTFGAK
jgi:hypothetical protein